MPNYNPSTIARIADIKVGIRVDKAALAHTVIAGVGQNYFTIVGGKVLMTGLVGEVTVEAVGATTAVWSAVPTTGTAQPVAASLDLDPAIVGSALTITGVASDAMTYNASATGLPMMSGCLGVVLCPGVLKMTFGAASGTTKWSMFYVPIDDGAYVEAA